MATCEDYPCCGHTDGLGCDWTYTPEAQAFDLAHSMCDHEAGFCDAYDDEAHEYDEDDTDDDGRPWCYGCDSYAVCGEWEPDGAPCCPDPGCNGNPCDFPGYAANH